MRSAFQVIALTLAVIVMSQPVAAHHHPRPLPSPWTDRRPVVKLNSKNGHRQLRPYRYWQSPSYLETAPVVFPGPAPTLKPLFAPAR